MGGMFSSKSKRAPASRIQEHDMVVLQMKQMRDKLRQYKRRIELQLERDRQVAKRLVTEGKKDRAILLLRKKKHQEKLMARIEGELDNMEQIINDVEFSHVQQEVVKSLERGNECLKQLHRFMSIEDVERILSETREGVEYQREIDDVLSRMSSLNDDDREDIERELEDLTRLELPDAPTDQLPGKTAVADQNASSVQWQSTSPTRKSKPTRVAVPAT